MARKKRRFEQLEAAAANPTEKKKYNDPFKKQVNERLEDVGKHLEGKGRTILYGIGAVVIIAALVMLFIKSNRSSNAKAQFALGKAIETSQARVSETAGIVDPSQKTFKTEKERAETAIAEFQGVADTFGGSVGEKCKYFIAVNKLSIDRAAGIAELEDMAKSGSDTGKLAKFALAQTRLSDNRPDEALSIFMELVAMDNPIIAKDTINFEIAKIYEKQGKKQEAIDLFFNIAKTASEAKDLDGKAVRMTETATNAKKKLKELDPERAKQIPEPTPDSPFGAGGPVGM